MCLSVCLPVCLSVSRRAPLLQFNMIWRDSLLFKITFLSLVLCFKVPPSVNGELGPGWLGPGWLGPGQSGPRQLGPFWGPLFDQISPLPVIISSFVIWFSLPPIGYYSSVEFIQEICICLTHIYQHVYIHVHAWGPKLV